MTHGKAPRSVTIQDVARQAGVGKATAARALGGYGSVSADVQRRVDAAADGLGYRPNELARSMTTGRTNTIGVVIGDIENPFFGLAVRGITDMARAEGFDVILANTGEELDFEQAAVRVLLDRRVDGLIVSAAQSSDPAHLQDVLDLGRPLVLLDRSVPGLQTDAVTVDNTRAALLAVRHLTDAGHRRIAFISSATATGPPSAEFNIDAILLSTVRDRICGMLAAAAEVDIKDPARYIRLGGRGLLACQTIVHDLLELKDPPTAILTSDSMVALHILKTLVGLNVPVPEKISMITFDDADWTTITSPPLTVIAQPIYDLGAEASKILIRRIRGDTAIRPMHIFDAALISRSSVAPPEEASV